MLKSTFYAENFVCRLSWSISNNFGAILLLKYALQPEIAKNSRKFTKTPYFGVQGGSRSSMLLPPESSLAVLVMMSNTSMFICNRSHARRINSGMGLVRYRDVTDTGTDGRTDGQTELRQLVYALGTTCCRA